MSNIAMSSKSKVSLVVGLVVGAVAGVAGYLISCLAATWPIISIASLALAFDTDPKRLRFAIHLCILAAVVAFLATYLIKARMESHRDSGPKSQC